jgi:hypothetical protein
LPHHLIQAKPHIHQIINLTISILPWNKTPFFLRKMHPFFHGVKQDFSPGFPGWLRLNDPPAA